MFAGMRRSAGLAVVWGICGIAGLGGLACSTPSKVNPADAARVRKIDAIVERLRQAYTSKDADAFHGLLMPIESLRLLETEIRRDFAAYERISLDFAIDRVMVEGSDVAVFFHWQGQWYLKSDEQPQRERGHAVIRLVGDQNLALSGVDGDAPFGMAGRRFPGERPRGR